MKLFFHFAFVGFANTYLIGPENGGDAIIIDPGVMDIQLLSLIENNNYYVKHILITHAHRSHINGIKTLLKIYDAQIYSHLPSVLDYSTCQIKDRQQLNFSGIEVETFQVPGHSNDSIVYKINNLLFTGDTLSAGRISTTENSFTRSLLLRSIEEHILPLDEKIIIFPGHGPPSTLKAEKLFNSDLKLLE